MKKKSSATTGNDAPSSEITISKCNLNPYQQLILTHERLYQSSVWFYWSCRTLMSKMVVVVALVHAQLTWCSGIIKLLHLGRATQCRLESQTCRQWCGFLQFQRKTIAICFCSTCPARVQNLLEIWNIESYITKCYTFLTLRCSENAGYELLFKIHNSEIIHIGHGKQVIIRYLHWLK